MGLFPPFLAKPLSRMYAANKLTRFLPAGTPCVVTNVPGPPMELYSDAAKLVRMHCLGLLTPGVGLFNAIFSHGDKLTISILGDRDWMPDPAYYTQCLRLAYEELRDAVLESPAQKKPARRKSAVKKGTRSPAKKRATRKKATTGSRAKPE
jgi:diacylglycerol O-acyltransferase